MPDFIYRHQSQVNLQAMRALQQAWLLAAELHTPLPPFLLQRSVAILEALQKYTTHEAVLPLLEHAKQQLNAFLTANTPSPNDSLNDSSSVLRQPPQALHVPWFDTAFPYPATLADLSLGAQWHQQIKASHAQPFQRLTLALAKLPYRSAYQEAVLALRAIIRSEPRHYEPALKLLYWLAASASFLEHPQLQPSGEQIIEALPGSELQALTIHYEELGVAQLPLLNQTDQKQLIRYFGAPTQTQTLREVHAQAWQVYAARLEANANR